VSRWDVAFCVLLGLFLAGCSALLLYLLASGQAR
jgi:hypothetical protein